MPHRAALRLAPLALLIALSLASAADAAKKKENGQRCANDSSCKSDHCRLAPALQLGDGHTYCMAAERKCALPGLDGADLGTKVYVGGMEVVCQDPRVFGKHPQFYRPND